MWRKHLIGGALFLLIVVGWLAFYHPNPHPSDAALIDNFQRHRDGFERLKEMFVEDANVRTVATSHVTLDGYKDWPRDTEKGFSIRRLDEYWSVFSKLGCYDIHSVSRGEGSVLHIPVSRVYSERDGDYESIVIEKGYAYALVEPSPLVDSLDEMNFDSRGRFYKKIEEHWYLYHEWGVIKPE